MRFSPRRALMRLHGRFADLENEIAALRQETAQQFSDLHAKLETIQAAVGVDPDNPAPPTRHGIVEVQRRLDALEQRTLSRIQRAVARVEGRQVAEAEFDQAAFQVFSQDAEDGLLAWLAAIVPPSQRYFVEIGVETYVESNTRFLLTDGQWEGLVIEADVEAVTQIRASEWCLAYRLQAEQAFVTVANANEIIARHAPQERIGVLSIDIDGNDWWVWDAIDVVDPLIVVVEFNGMFGPDASITIPYAPDFNRRTAHHSWMYFGASLRAFERLGRRRGYSLVGLSPSAVNAFFVKDGAPGAPPARTTDDLWRPSRFSDFHDESGQIITLPDEEQRARLLQLPFVQVREDGTATHDD